MTDERFGSRLRRERERRQIPLSSICANTKISLALFEGLERDDISKWPSGIFRRSFIRAYAQGVGLDPDDIAREFFERFPDPTEPRLGPSGLEREQAVPVLASSPASDAGVRLTLADTGAPFMGGSLLADMRRRWAAVAWDAGVVVAIAAALFAICGKFWLPLGIVMLGYYLGGILLLGNTPGVCLWAPGVNVESTPSTILVARAAGLKSAVAVLSRLNRSTHVAHTPRTLRP